MATEVAQYSAGSTAAEVAERGRIGLIVLAAIASGLVLGLVFVLAVFDGTEAQITGSALVALGAGSHGSTHSALLEEGRFASITTRAITDVVRTARSGQPLR